jgi:hypothetical protein
MSVFYCSGILSRQSSIYLVNYVWKTLVIYSFFYDYSLIDPEPEYKPKPTPVPFAPKPTPAPFVPKPAIKSGMLTQNRS